MKKNGIVLALTAICFLLMEYLIGLTGLSLDKYEVICLFMLSYLCMCQLINSCFEIGGDKNEDVEKEAD